MILRIYEEIYKRKTFTIPQIVDQLMPEYGICGRAYVGKLVKQAVLKLVREGQVRKISDEPVTFENLYPTEEAVEEKPLKTCPVCGKQFYPKRGVQDVYCSAKCRERARAKRRKTQVRKNVRRYYRGADSTAENHRKPWSEKEVQFLKENYGKLTQKEIAKRLGRTVPAVKAKVKELGLKAERKLIKL